MKRFLALGLAAALSLSLAACSGGSGGTGEVTEDGYNQLDLKISVATGVTGIDYMVADRFAQLISEKTNGAVTATVYSDSQLTGSDMSKTIDVLLAGGTYEICTASGAVLSGVEEKFLTHSLPFAIDSYATADELLDGTGGEYYSKLMEERGMTLLGLFHNGLKQLTNGSKEIHSPADLQGLKIRVPSGEVALETFRALGADPISMSWGEVYTALQQGTVDGHENSYMTIDSGSIQEVNPYITELNWQYECYGLIANSNDFNSWNEATQQAVLEAGQEASQWGREYQETEEANIKQRFIDEGVHITELTEEEHQAFVDATADVRAYFIEKYGEEACTAWGIVG